MNKPHSPYTAAITGGGFLYEETDSGWTITLGRGLDMFEKYSPFSIANSRQDKRKCKECMITYLKSKSI